ncbi:hypothetical protein [Paracoccus sp. R86501]|uniref:hypothetical protein n=1 Tax=Paracoccus sp. R86501 TaxID=3101711 RepID=UPI00366FB7DB
MRDDIEVLMPTAMGVDRHVLLTRPKPVKSTATVTALAPHQRPRICGRLFMPTMHSSAACGHFSWETGLLRPFISNKHEIWKSIVP